MVSAHGISFMNKASRVLMLYIRLAAGEKVNKAAFCNEMQCQPRSFDRDIEDIRIFLSDTFELAEIIYDWKERAYYMCKIAPIRKVY